MTKEELAEATKEFDKEFVADTFRPLTPAQRARLRKAMRKKPGKKRSGQRRT